MYLHFISIILKWQRLFEFTFWGDNIIIDSVNGSYTEAWTKWPPFLNDIFKNIILNEHYCVLIKLSLQYVH